MTLVWLAFLLVVASLHSAYAKLREVNYVSGKGVAPGLVYGTAWKKDETAKYVLAALRAGFRAFDTAAHPKHYNESLVGEALTRALGDASYGVARDDLWIQTKFTPDACNDQPEQHHPYDPHADVANRVRQSYESSLRRLGMSRLDSYILHAPFPKYEHTLEAWREMEKIHSETGGLMEIGVSNFNIQQLQKLLNDAHVKPAFVQNRCLQKHGYDAEVRELCRQHDILYQGFWLLTGNREVVGSSEVENIARAHKKTAQQIFYRFAFQELGVMVLSGTKSDTHMREALQIDAITLSADESTRLRDIEVSKFTSHDPVQVEITNAMHEDVELFWKHPDSGAMVPNAKLAVGARTSIGTFHSHKFVGKIGDETVFYWRADRERGESQSTKVDAAVSAEFKNQGQTELNVYWQEAEGAHEVHQGYLGSFDSLHVNTFVGHTFLVRDQRGKLVRSWKAALLAPDVQIVDLNGQNVEL